MGKFKVGDRVRFVENYASARIGGEGHVTSLWGDDGVNVVSNGVSYGCLAKRVELVEQPAAFTIEAGKFYKTRDGRKVGPIIANWADDKHWPFRWPEETMYYERGGFSCPGSRNLHRDADDLIAEWVDEHAASNDNAAPAKFKVGDVVRATETLADIKAGQNYLIVEVDPEDDSMPIRVIDDVGDRYWLFNDQFELVNSEAANDNVVATLSVDAGNVHEELDAIIAKLERIVELKRQVGLAA